MAPASHILRRAATAAPASQTVATPRLVSARHAVPISVAAGFSQLNDTHAETLPRSSHSTLPRSSQRNDYHHIIHSQPHGSTALFEAIDAVQAHKADITR